MTKRIAVGLVVFAVAMAAFLLTSGMEPGEVEKGVRAYYGQ